MEGTVRSEDTLEQFVTVLDKAQDDPTNVMLLAVVAQGIRLCTPMRGELANYKRLVQNVAVGASKGSFFVHIPITLQPYDGVSPSMTRGPVRIYGSQVGSQKVVVKELHLGNKHEQEAAQLSLAFMSILSHPNLQASIGADLTPSALRTATILCQSGNLREFIGARPKNESLQQPMIIETISGLRFLHSCGVLHANLKPENVLIWWPRPSASGSLVTLTDYGSKSNVGTSLEFYAPELLNGAAASEAADVYSLGMITWTILAWRAPEKKNPTPAELSDLKQRLLNGKLPPIPAEWPANLRRMVKNCRSDARDRPSASDLFLMHLDASLDKERAGRKHAEAALAKASDRIVELEAEVKLAKFGKRLRAGSVPPAHEGADPNSDLTMESQLLRLGGTLTKMKTKLHEWRVSETALLPEHK